MKRNEIGQLLAQISASSGTPADIHELGFENVYQEFEMDAPYVNAQRDISYTTDVVQLHSHNFYEFIYCRSGNIQYLLGTKRYRIQHGDIILVPPGVSHRPLFLEQLVEPYERYVAWISKEYFSALYGLLPEITQLGLPRDIYLLRTTGTAQSEMENAFFKLTKEDDMHTAAWQTRMFALCTEIVVQIVRLLSSCGAPPLPEQKTLLDEIVEYIEQSLSEHLSLDSIARRFLVSESSVSKLFQNKMDLSFYRFVTQRRLIAAKTLIWSGEALQNIPEKVGFSDYSTFFRAFKKEYGLSPVKFKQII